MVNGLSQGQDFCKLTELRYELRYIHCDIHFAPRSRLTSPVLWAVRFTVALASRSRVCAIARFGARLDVSHAGKFLTSGGVSEREKNGR
jgi:hypothetical protein